MMHLHIIRRKDAKAAGLKKYFTGKACHKGHIAEMLTSVFGCTQCAKDRYEQNGDYFKEKGKRYREANKEKVAADKKAYAEKNREKLLAYWKSVYQKVKGDRLPKMREDYKENGRVITERQRAARARNPEKHRETARRYRERNPELIRSFWENRRARKVSAEGSFGKEDVDRMLESQKRKCASCYERLAKKEDGQLIYHIDHIQPLAKGGTNWPYNLQILCPSCNMRKSDKHPLDWAKENGKLL